MTRVVVKLGGHALDALEPSAELLVAMANDLRALQASGTGVVVVHGGGPQIQSLLDAVGLHGDFVEGYRVTNETTLAYVAMALARVNILLVAALNAGGLASVGVSGADHSVLRASPLGDSWGRVGGVPRVDVGYLTALWANGLAPIVCPVAVDESGGLLNCNADTVAGALAAALDADALLLLSDVDQLRAEPSDESTALASVDEDEVRALLNQGSAREGMRPKLVAALDALEGGAGRVVVANGTRPHAVRDVLAGTILATEVVANRAVRGGATP